MEAILWERTRGLLFGGILRVSDWKAAVVKIERCDRRGDLRDQGTKKLL
jgi:hypothetical protein